MSDNQLSLFGDSSPQSLATAAVHVRSHMRRVKGAESAHRGPQGQTATPPHNGTATSRAAARHVGAAGMALDQRGKVLRAITEAGGRGTTRADIAQATGIIQSTVCARVYELLGKHPAVSSTVFVEEVEGAARVPDCGGTVRQKVIRRLRWVLEEEGGTRGSASIVVERR